MALEDKQAVDLWDKLFPWRIGDRVKVINISSAFFSRIGTIKNIFKVSGSNQYAVKFGIYIVFGDNTNYEYFYDKELERASNECK